MQPASPGSRFAISGIAPHTRGRHRPSEPDTLQRRTIPSQRYLPPAGRHLPHCWCPPGDRQSPHTTYSFTAQVAAHAWLTHTALKQSLSTEHVSPESHRTDVTTTVHVRLPSILRTVVAGVRSLHTISQNPEAQSLLCTQARPSAHAAQSIPPQSISVSTPFCSPSLTPAVGSFPRHHGTRTVWGTDRRTLAEVKSGPKRVWLLSVWMACILRCTHQYFIIIASASAKAWRLGCLLRTVRAIVKHPAFILPAVAIGPLVHLVGPESQRVRCHPR